MTKPRKNEQIKNASAINEEAYVTWGDDLTSKQEALHKSSESMSEYSLIQRTSAARRYGSDFSNLLPGIDGRPGLTRSDYDYFRPDEAVPKKVKLIIKKAEDVYQRVGLVKNVIDLMGDFGSQGIRLVHENKKIEKFFRAWFKKIKGKERSERFLNNLYKTGNIIINRQTAKISLKITDKLYKTLSSPDLNIKNMDEVLVEKREIPWKYTFIDPFYVEVSAGALSSFSQYKTYELQLPAHLRRIINSPKTQQEIDIIKQLPTQILEAAKAKKPFPLDPDKTLVYHYKKDDWQSWAYPMIYAIMDDITVIEKLKLADMAALDGAISNIRIFKLGNLEHKIAPTKAAAAKLAEILGNNVGGGTMDLVWGPDIELIESKTNVHQFLGEAKYNPHLNAVYAGLGIPPTLTGTFGAAGTTNNFISLKTLTQRLQYGRDILTEFWEKEISLVQKAMKFKDPAKIEFDRMDLSNEEAEKALLIQLVDRNLVSDELLQTRFGLDPDMEKSRLNRETRERKSSKMINKSGPWHDPQPENALRKIALQSGVVAPSQVGLELEPKKPGESNSLELKTKLTPTKLAKDSSESLPGEPQQGRPKLSKDSKKRKTKEFSPQTGASLTIWSHKAQEDISSIINPIMLEFYSKKNLRSLSSSQFKELENLKTELFLRLTPFCTISKEEVLSNISNINYDYLHAYSVWVKEIVADLGRELTVEEQKYTKASYYTFINQH